MVQYWTKISLKKLTVKKKIDPFFIIATNFNEISIAYIYIYIYIYTYIYIYIYIPLCTSRCKKGQFFGKVGKI